MEQTITRSINNCRQCGYQWFPHLRRRKNQHSTTCPHCQSSCWQDVKTDKSNLKRCKHCITSESNYNVLSRRLKVRRLLSNGFSYKKIGEDMGVSRQRVQQLIALPKNSELRILTHCTKCGNPFVNRRGDAHHKGDDIEILCIRCHRQEHKNPPSVCPDCGQPVSNKHVKRCAICRHKNKTITVTCSKCGKIYTREKNYHKNKRYQNKHYYCSQGCFRKRFK